MDEFIKVDNLVRYYTQKKVEYKDGKKSSKQTIKAVDGVSFELKKGEILGVIGESGCGKSTLGRLLMRLEDPTNGDVYINGVSTSKLLKSNRLDFRKKCQIVFQNPFDTFDPRYTIRKILMETCSLHKIGKTQEERLQTCIQILEEAGLRPAEDYLDRYPFELSGGQLQRISISLLSKIILYSLIFSNVTSTGNSSFNVIAAFNTVPPFSLQYGGVSLQPPPKFTLSGNLTTCLSLTILALSLYVRLFIVAFNTSVCIVSKHF